MSLSTVIVDDEQLARDELAYLLKSADDVNVVAQGKNGLEAVNLIKEHNPDLVFLDVQMPGLDGFGVIKKLLDKKIRLPKIVFATAFVTTTCGYIDWTNPRASSMTHVCHIGMTLSK